MTRKRVRQVVLPVALTLGCLGATIAMEHRRKAGDAPPPIDGQPLAGADVTAMLGGLRPGDELAGKRVRRVLAPHDRVVNVEVEAAGTFFTLEAAVHHATPFTNPPRTTGRYDIFFSVPAQPQIPTDEVNAALDAFAGRISRVEDQVPVPKGM